MSYCYVCGKEKDRRGGTAVPVCAVLDAHPRCFVAHQVFNILNSGKAEGCPAGEWSVDWQKALRKYVKPQIAAEVEKVIALLESNGINARNVENVGKEKSLPGSIVEALKTGSESFIEAILS